MTNEELKNLLPPQMRIINTTEEVGKQLLQGETVTDNDGEPIKMGDNDYVAVPDDTDKRLEALEKKVNEGSAKLYRHEITVLWGIETYITFYIYSSRKTAYTNPLDIPSGHYSAVYKGNNADNMDGFGAVMLSVDEVEWYVGGAVCGLDGSPNSVDGVRAPYDEDMEEGIEITDTVTEL